MVLDELISKLLEEREHYGGGTPVIVQSTIINKEGEVVGGNPSTLPPYQVLESQEHVTLTFERLEYEDSKQ